MKLHHKFFLSIVTFIAFTTFIILITRQIQLKHIGSLHRIQERHIREDLENMLDLKGTSLKNLTAGFSRGDEIVSFVKRPDRKWALENIETAMFNFNSDAIWLYDDSRRPVYQRHFLPYRDSIQPPVSAPVIGRWLSDKAFVHFYFPFDQSVIEFYGAPVQPSPDMERKAKPAGYILFGRFWSDRYLNETGAMAGSRLSVTSAPPDTAKDQEISDHEMIFYHELPGLDRRPAVWLKAVHEWPVVFLISEYTAVQTFLGIFFSLILLAVFPFLIYRWTLYPLGRIDRALAGRDPKWIRPFLKRRDIFGRLAGLLNEQLSHSTALESNIRQLSETEKALKKSEEKYRQLFDRQMDAILVYDAEYYNCIDANPAALEMYRYPETELPKRTALDLCDEKNILIDSFQRAKNDGHHYVPLIRQRRSDGTVFFTEMTVCLSTWNGRECICTIIRDISTRVETETRLQQQRQYLKQIIDISPNFIFVKDAGGRIVLANEALAELRGMKAEEITGKTESEINPHTEELVRYAETDRRVIETRAEVFIPEEKIIMPDGSARWLQTVKRPVFGPEGEVSQIVGVATDITFHKEAEEKILRLYHLYALLSQINQVILRQRDRDLILKEICSIAVGYGHFRLAWSGVFAEDQRSFRAFHYYGLEIRDIQQFIARLPLDHEKNDPLIFNSVQNSDLDPLVKYLSSQWDIHAFALIPLFCGKNRIGMFAVHSRTSGFFDEQEVGLMKELGMDVSYAMEVNEIESLRRHSESELRKLYQAVEQSPAVVMITDQNGVIEYVNQAYARISGYAISETLGRKPNFFKPGFLADRDFRMMWQTLQRGEEWKGEFRNIRKDGQHFWESAVIAPIWNEKNEITHFLAIKEDITRHRQMEADLQQSRKMDSIGRLAGGIAHDFNNLLTAILGYGGMLQFKLPASSPLREDVEEIMNAAKRAAGLTHQLLAFSRKQTMHFEPLDLNEIVLSNCKLLRRILEENIELNTDVHPEPVPILADRNQIEQVLMNLVINSRDAIKDKGHIDISVSTGRQRASGEEPDPEKHAAILSVSDSGCGIAPEAMPHLFEPFFTTKDKGKGTGLGLSTVYGIVKQSGGEIEVSSVPGQGAVFTIYLPLGSDVPPAANDNENQPEPSDAYETILLVEDDETVCGLVREILENSGYHVLVALNGEQALQIINEYKGKIHLMLTDIIMPEMDGKELSDAARKALPDLKVIYMSGYAEEKLSTMNLSPDEIAFVQKPFLPDALVQAVRKKLDEP